ncbi:MAG: gliding motility-associated C-terminal domain-containing protein [Bacteroidia bacterium]|nr:gliding motility-associated C-terminal domain-containing protein [Bacteroidia bacterium]
MKHIEDIDQLIKQGMEGFTPPAPPDVWSQISSQIQAPVGLEGQGLWHGIKQANLLVKTIAVTSTIAISGLGVYLFSPEPKVSNTEPISIVEEKPSLGTEIKTKEDIGSTSIESPAKMVNKEQDVAKKERPKPTENLLVQPEPKHEEPSVLPMPEVKVGEKKQEFNHKGADENVGVISLHEDFDPIAGEPEEEITDFPEPKFGNVFSPNADGKNDRWEILMPVPNFFRVKVFSLDGNLVFESDQPEKTWNGLNVKNGMECENGSYAFQIEYQYPKQKNVQSIRGYVKLLR